MRPTATHRQEALNKENGWSITPAQPPTSTTSNFGGCAELHYEPSGGGGGGGGARASWRLAWCADGHDTGLISSLNTLPQIDLKRVTSADCESQDDHLPTPPAPVGPVRTEEEVYMAVDQRMASLGLRAVERGSGGDCFFRSLTAGGSMGSSYHADLVHQSPIAP